MAQKITVVLEDDIDGGPASETVQFSLDGVAYEIDLNDANAARLRDTMAPYVGPARRTGGRSTSGRARGRGRGRHNRTAEIRAWARDNGWDVPERGRVSAEIREAYASAK